MRDQAKFEDFKQKLVEENEEKYGQEVREKYGDEAADRANQRVQGMSQAQYDEVARLSQEIMAALAVAMQNGDPAGEAAQQAADLHRHWLIYFWNTYSSEAHRGLADMYVQDPRFTAYYDALQPGTAAFLRQAIHIYTAAK
jgi:hypothetical protein